MRMPPLIASLTRHKMMTLMLFLQIALTCAIVCNVSFIVSERIGRVSVPTGLAEHELSVIQVLPPAGVMDHPEARRKEAIEQLRQIQGVTSVTATDSMPLGPFDGQLFACRDAVSSNGVSAGAGGSEGCVLSSIFNGTPGTARTLGLRIVSGRDFLPNEYATANEGMPLAEAKSAILTRTLARKLLGSENAVGQNIYINLPGLDAATEIHVVGIVETLLRPHPGAGQSAQDSVILSGLPSGPLSTFILRSAPRDRNAVIKRAVTMLHALSPTSLIANSGVSTYDDIKERYFEHDQSMIALLVTAMCGLLVITGIGIAGLSNFWVQQRRKQIGVRRAIGARRGDILVYFLCENALIAGSSAVVGCCFALGLNRMLMVFYEVDALPLYYLPIGALLLLALCQIAAAVPAIGASSVAPVEAIR